MLDYYLVSQVKSSLLLSSPLLVFITRPAVLVSSLGSSHPPPDGEVPAGAEDLLVVRMPGHVSHTALVAGQDLQVRSVTMRGEGGGDVLP